MMNKLCIYFIIILITALNVDVNAQNEIQTNNQNRENKKQERQNKRKKKNAHNYLIYQDVVKAIKSKQFVLQANSITDKRTHNPFRKGDITKQVSNQLNFIKINENNGCIQLVWNEDKGENGIGGITVNGIISDYEIKGERGKNQYITFHVMGAKLNADIRITLYKSNNKAEAIINESNTGKKVRINGFILPLKNSDYYKSGRSI